MPCVLLEVLNGVVGVGEIDVGEHERTHHITQVVVYEELVFEFMGGHALVDLHGQLADVRHLRPVVHLQDLQLLVLQNAAQRHLNLHLIPEPFDLQVLKKEQIALQVYLFLVVGVK